MCVLDAAVLLKADWDQSCHELWVCIIPPKEVSQDWTNISGHLELNVYVGSSQGHGERWENRGGSCE